MAPVASHRCTLGCNRPFAGRQRSRLAARAAVLDAPSATADGDVASDSSSMDAMYAQFEDLLLTNVNTFESGDVVDGTVITTDRKGALVDIGGKGAAFVPVGELSCAPVSDAAEILRPGMVRQFTVTGQKKDEVIMLSMAERERKIMWRRLQQMQEEDVTVTGTILSANRGGVVVDIIFARGFVPNSHLGSQQHVDKEEIMGNKIDLKFLDVEEESGKIMLSARRVQSADTLMHFKIGDVVEGVVSKVAPFGAFIEVAPGGTGLLHISQISHDRVMNIEDLLSVGDRLKVMIMAHDRERGRLAFSTKKLEPTPGDMLKDPAVVFARAEEMAQLFKIRVAAAEQAARDEEARLAGTAEVVPAGAAVGAASGGEVL